MARNILIAGAGVTAISQERDRQIQVEGWTPEHDAKHFNGELAKAAGCYALADDAREKCGDISKPFVMWPWTKEWWKPSPDNRIKELAKAGALIAAEIDRLIALGNQSENDTNQIRVFHFYCGQLQYGYAAQTKEQAIEQFIEDTGDQYTMVEEIPESEWDKPFIKVYEDNDLTTEPFYESIRSRICGTEPQLIFSTDQNTFD